MSIKIILINICGVLFLYILNRITWYVGLLNVSKRKIIVKIKKNTIPFLNLWGGYVFKLKNTTIYKIAICIINLSFVLEILLLLLFLYFNNDLYDVLFNKMIRFSSALYFILIIINYLTPSSQKK